MVGQAKLRKAYDEYRKLGGAEISFEASLYLRSLCAEITPKKVYDLGSGWSSFLLRTLLPEAHIVSVDMKEEWLQKSIDFCTSQGVSSTGFTVWSKIQEEFASHRSTGDLVLHDMGGKCAREETMGEAFDLVAPHGTIVLDDMHKDRFREEAGDTARKRKFQQVDEGGATRDPQVDAQGCPIARYCWVFRRTE
jgi:predicted O-methyltransferase YrrM